jgi:hypothetical protein
LYGQPANRLAGIVHLTQTNVNNIVDNKSKSNRSKLSDKKIFTSSPPFASQHISEKNSQIGVYDIVDNIVDI